MKPPRLGVDLVEVEAVRRRFEGQPQLVPSVFTADEMTYCRLQAAPWPHLAARFAAKEAALKALGTGLAGDMAWLDIEVTRDAAGAPGLAFHGATRRRLDAAGLGQAVVSLSHTDVYAVAIVTLYPS